MLGRPVAGTHRSSPRSPATRARRRLRTGDAGRTRSSPVKRPLVGRDQPGCDPRHRRLAAPDPRRREGQGDGSGTLTSQMKADRPKRAGLVSRVVPPKALAVARRPPRPSPVADLRCIWLRAVNRAFDTTLTGVCAPGGRCSLAVRHRDDQTEGWRRSSKQGA